MKRIFLILFLIPSLAFAQQLGTVTDLHTPRTPCPTGFTCGNYIVSTPYTPSIRGYAAILEPTGPVNATNLYFAGASGTGFWQGWAATSPLVQSFWDVQANAGQRIIQWVWLQLWSTAIFNGLPVYSRIASCRAATVIDFFQRRYGGDFNVLGSSWGSGEVAFAIANWPITVHRAFIISGPMAMNIAEGCETTDFRNPYYYSPGVAGGVDLFMGLTSRPCYNRDASYDQIWRQNSVEFGGVYVYPNTGIRIYVGQNDERDITSRGGFYNDLLRQAGQTDLQFSVVPSCGHEFQSSPTGLAALEQGLLTP